MKIENNKIIFEVVQCWNCKGSGKDKHYKRCPNDNKKTYGKKCEHCGATNKHSHKSIGYDIIDCNLCKGSGKRLENRFDFVPKDIIDSLDITEVVKVNRNSTFNESYLGLGQIYGCSDYGRSHDLTNDELIAEIKKDMTCTQALSITDKDDNLLKFKVIQRNDGYSLIGY